MAPVADVDTATPDHPAKRRKVREANGAKLGGDSDRDDAKARALKQLPGKLSIRGGRPEQEDEEEHDKRSERRHARKHEAGHDDDNDDDGRGGRSESEMTDSPSAQLAGAVVRSRRPRSRTPSELDASARPSRTPSSNGSSPVPARQQQQRRRQQNDARPAPKQRRPSSTASSSSRSRSRARSPTRSPSLRSRSPTPPSSSRSRSRSPSRATADGPTHTQNGNARRHRRRRRRRSASPPPRPHYHRVLAMRGHDGPISQVRISPDGRWIASASADATARIWDAATGQHITTLVGHIAGISCLAWSPDSNTLATGSDDKSIRLWDRVTAEPAHAVTGGIAEGGSEDDLLDAELAGLGGGSAAATPRGRQRVLAQQISGAIHGSGASGGARGTRLPLLGHHNYVYCLAFSPKGNILASGSYDEAVFLWDVRAGRLMRSLPAHSDPVSGIDFCCDGTLVVSCSTDGLIRIWDTGTGQCLRTLLLLEENPAVTNVCFSPNGRYVLAFNLDSCIRMWDYVAQPSALVKKTYQGHTNQAFSIGGCFGILETTKKTARRRAGRDVDDDDGDDGRDPKPLVFVAAASEDGDVVLWDVGTKAIVQRLRGAHKNGVCFWVDVCGATMVSCGQDGWINVYRHQERKDDADDEDDGGRKLDKDDKEDKDVNGNADED